MGSEGDMTYYPEFQDAVEHRSYGKSQLPFLIEFSTLHQSVPLHYHNFAELCLVVERTGTEILNGQPQALRRGTVSFRLPNHIHEIHVKDTPIRIYTCLFD